uniref:C2H2-type domain-containing protein n=1 Tax=Meloidogyne javanica TaxID=6303 RepID=A0A915MZA5_MELJA
MPCSSEMRFCLICKRKVSTNGSVSVEDMVDHQNRTRHIVEFDSLKNWYLERVCQLIYSDFDYVEKHGVEAIRRMGSAFGDRKRLEDLEVKSEHELQIIEADDEVESVEAEPPPPQPNKQTTPRPTPPIDPQARIDLLDHWTRSIEKMTKSPDIFKNLSNSNNSIVSYSNNSNVDKNNLSKSGRCSFKDSTQSTAIPIVHGTGTPATENLSLEQKTKRCLADLHKQITNGIPKRKCQMCNQNVDNDYRSMKNHVFRVHFRPYNLNKFTQLLERCFKKDGNNCNNNIFITNDLQCNVCGRELRTKTGRFNHVSVCHSDYIWKCIYAQCDFKVNSFSNFLRHLQIQHRKKSFQLEHFEKDAYIRLRADYELKLTPLVRKCFPFDLPAIILGGNITEEEIPVDEIVSK